MVETFLSTKLFIPPIRHPFVVRERLNSLLETSRNQKITLVSAPAGFGKSTLVASWLENNNRKAAWLSLDKQDNSPTRFWSCIIKAIQTLKPEIGQNASEIAKSTQLRDIEPVVITLLNDLAVSQTSILLILDDYHAIDSLEIHNSFSFFLERLPPNIQVILLTRIDPQLPLGRLRAAGELCEIRASELQFSLDEASDFFKAVMHLDLTPDQIASLEKHTEGWIVGLKLAALSLQRQSDQDSFIQNFSGSHRFILDYLTEEVLNVLPEEQHFFLLQTSILDSFCADLCNAVTENPNSPKILEDLYRENMFIVPLDASGEWFRYHHLFKNLLEVLLEQSNPSDISKLHLRAMQWYEDSDHLAEAIDHAFQSGDIQQTKELIVKHYNPMLHRGGVKNVLEWVKRLPDGMAKENIDLALANCWALHLSGQTLAIAPYVDYADQTFEQMVAQNELQDEQIGLYQSQIYMMRSVLERSQGNLEKSLAYGEKAVQVVPTEIGYAAGPAWNLLGAARVSCGDIDGGIEAYRNGMEIGYQAKNLLSAFAAAFWATMYSIRQGNLSEAYLLCQGTLEQASNDNLLDFPATGLLYVAQSMIELEREHLDQARQLVLKGGSFSEALRYGRFIRANLYMALGDMENATATMKEIESILLATEEPYSIGEMHFEWARLAIHLDKIEAVEEHFLELDKIVKQKTSHPLLRSLRDSLAAYLNISQSMGDNALSILDDAICKARASNTNGDLLRLLILQTIALRNKGYSTLSNKTFKEALLLGESQGYIYTWLDAGKWILPILSKAQKDSNYSNKQLSYIERIISVGDRIYGNQYSETKLSTILTERELQIMKLICSGHSNPQIANELFVTLNTVKKHTSNIYSKLGVSSRTQAIARVRELELL
jgi:LuxR family maltose regulon positive regulatory protein